MNHKKLLLCLTVSTLSISIVHASDCGKTLSSSPVSDIQKKKLEQQAHLEQQANENAWKEFSIEFHTQKKKKGFKFLETPPHEFHYETHFPGNAHASSDDARIDSPLSLNSSDINGHDAQEATNSIDILLAQTEHEMHSISKRFNELTLLKAKLIAAKQKELLNQARKDMKTLSNKSA